MNKLASIALSACASALAAAAALPAQAAMIVPGGTLTGVTVVGDTSIYSIFGNPGNPGGGGGESAAVLTTFAAGSGNIFTFSAGGLIGCCGGSPDISPDGGGGSMSITGANGLSDLTGSRSIPLVGVFTTDSDPSGGTPPDALDFDAANPTSLSPLLHQVFYIGDGRAGFNNAAGAFLQFTAPSNAQRLYLGTIDAQGFNGQSGHYADNEGEFLVDINLAQAPGIPEPATWAMLIVGFAAVGAALRRDRRGRDRKGVPAQA